VVQAEFYGGATDYSHQMQGADVEGAQGLWLWCPCGYGKPEYPLDGPRPHAIIVPFKNPQNAPPVPANHGPTSRDGSHHPRWTMSGTGLGDLTLSPSIDVGTPSCWHGHVVNGRWCQYPARVPAPLPDLPGSGR
jgi:hypothetical protein